MYFCSKSSFFIPTDYIFYDEKKCKNMFKYLFRYNFDFICPWCGDSCLKIYEDSNYLIRSSSYTYLGCVCGYNPAFDDLQYTVQGYNGCRYEFNEKEIQEMFDNFFKAYETRKKRNGWEFKTF
jgi:hypothetical protein